MAIRPGTQSDLPMILARLREAALPTEDLASAQAAFLVDARAEGLAGVIGLLAFGQAGLLRSLAVDPALRGQGVGAELLAALEDRAAAQGIAELILLTETAERFFSQRGYRAIDRSSVPEALQQTAEFRSLCPASAVCMRKAL